MSEKMELTREEGKKDEPFTRKSFDFGGYKGGGYLLYFFDLKSRVAELKYLPVVRERIRIRSAGEIYLLQEPAFYIPQPVWALCRGEPRSLPFEFLSDRFERCPTSAAELDAMLRSSALQTIATMKTPEFKDIIREIATHAVAILATYAIMINLTGGVG